MNTAWNDIPSPEIIIEESNIDNVPPFEPIKLICSIASKKVESEYYTWSIAGITKTTKNKVVKIFLPNQYCGRKLSLKVDFIGVVIPTYDGTIVKVPQLCLKGKSITKDETYILSAQKDFTAICKTVNIKSFEFYDKETNKIISRDSILPPGKAYIRIEVAGLNGKFMRGIHIYFNKKEIFIPEWTLPRVNSNLLIFPIEIPSNWEYSKSTSTLEVHLQNSQWGIDKNISIQVQNYLIYNRKNISTLTQPVVTGGEIVESNFKPCFYSQIETSFKTREENENLIIFDENINTSSVKEINLIGGKKELTFKMKNYSTKSCLTGRHIENKAIVYAGNNSFELISPEKYNAQQISGEEYAFPINNDGTLKVCLRHRYESNNMFDYLWNAPVQKGSCMISSCRYSNKVPICIYPDIEWKIALGLSNQKYAMSSTNMGNVYGRYQKYFEEAKQIGVDRYLKRGDLELCWAITAEYDDNKTLKINPKIETGIEKFFEVFTGIYKTLRKMTGRDVAEIKARNIPLFNKTAFTLDFLPPTFFIYGKWKYDYDSEGNIQLLRSIGIEFNPLIKAEGKVDVLACFEDIKPYGAIITFLRNAIELTNKGISAFSGGKIQFEPDVECFITAYGEVSINFEYTFNEDNQQVDLKPKVSLGIGCSLSIKAEVKVKTIIFLGSEYSGETGTGFEGKIETGFNISMHAGWEDNAGFYITPQIGFPGITMALTGETYLNIKIDKKYKKLRFPIEKEITFFENKNLLNGNCKYYFSK